jgi:hypothetical protein
MAQLLINDSGFSKGHFDNIFNPDYHMISCFTARHKEHEKVTCINYAGYFQKEGEIGMEKQAETFLSEKVDFEENTHSQSDMKKTS